jgi:chromosome segregation ATPase
MSEQNATGVQSNSGPGWHLPAIVVLGIVALAGVGIGWSASAKLDSTRQAVADQVKTMQQSVAQDLATVQDHVTQVEKTSTDLQGDLSVVTKKLKITQGQLKAAREEAAKMIDETSEKVTALDSSVKDELATKASTDDVKNVDTKVGGVRTDLDSTQNDLKMARSEIGTLIARNHDEIDQLRRLGERDYFEFTVAGKGKSQKVANLTIEFRAANEKKSQYTVALIVDDKRLEKKNRALNEPIFFYTSGTRQAEELVVNKVGKNEISGYVSIPKVNAQAASAATSSGK